MHPLQKSFTIWDPISNDLFRIQFLSLSCLGLTKFAFPHDRNHEKTNKCAVPFVCVCVPTVTSTTNNLSWSRSRSLMHDTARFRAASMAAEKAMKNVPVQQQQQQRRARGPATWFGAQGDARNK